MNNKFYFEELLTNAKAFCGLLLNGTIESNTDQVNNTFNNALNDALALQNAIYKQMENQGWYATQPVPESKIAQAVASL